jgi:hypothetical protein
MDSLGKNQLTTSVTVSRSSNVTVTDPTPITGASVTLTVGTIGQPQVFDPADAFAIGDALKDAARKAGYNPNSPPP